MAKNNHNQPADEGKPKKPKRVGKVTLSIWDDGRLTGEFWIWEEDEIGNRKCWTVGGEDFFTWLYRAYPRNVPVLASAMNVQIVNANLPIELQGPWLKRGADGKLGVVPGEFMDAARPPVGGKQGNRIAASNEESAAKAIGLTGSDLKAAVPDAPGKSGTNLGGPPPVRVP
jgi:hypothetical protein